MRPSLKKISKNSTSQELAEEFIYWLHQAGYAASRKSLTYLDEDGSDLIASKGYHVRKIPGCVHIVTNDSAWEVALNLANVGFGDEESLQVSLLLHLVGPPKTEPGRIGREKVGRLSHYWPDLSWPAPDTKSSEEEEAA